MRSISKSLPRVARVRARATEPRRQRLPATPRRSRRQVTRPSLDSRRGSAPRSTSASSRIPIAQRRISVGTSRPAPARRTDKLPAAGDQLPPRRFAVIRSSTQTCSIGMSSRRFDQTCELSDQSRSVPRAAALRERRLEVFGIIGSLPTGRGRPPSPIASIPLDSLGYREL